MVQAKTVKKMVGEKRFGIPKTQIMLIAPGLNGALPFLRRRDGAVRVLLVEKDAPDRGKTDQHEVHDPDLDGPEKTDDGLPAVDGQPKRDTEKSQDSKKIGPFPPCFGTRSILGKQNDGLDPKGKPENNSQARPEPPPGMTSSGPASRSGSGWFRRRLPFHSAFSSLPGPPGGAGNHASPNPPRSGTFNE